ncbi:MAG TPA: cytochrome c biogenesis protein ResB [Chthoniobacterales bacterium]
MNVKTCLRPLASLKLTIVCLTCAMVLVFVGTLDQVHIGIFEAQNRYFKSLFLYAPVPGTPFSLPWFPGGYLVGSVLLANLIAAHVARFKFAWKKAGILILHAGLILLLVGQLCTSLFQVESQLRLDEGQAKTYSESPYFDELAIVDKGLPDRDRVISVPDSMLRPGREIPLPGEGLKLVVNDFYPNSALVSPTRLPSPSYPHLTLGPMAVAVPLPKTYKQDERNVATTAVTLVDHGRPVGSWSLSTGFPQPVSLKIGQEPFQMTLQPQRYYRPFSIELLKFRHDRYAGTDIARNFSSQIRLVDNGRRENRESVIYMNHPLRYAGLSFYQAGFDNNDHTTVLQVVQNPSWLVPYISCGLLVAGLLLQFGMHLFNFSRKQVAR